MLRLNLYCELYIINKLNEKLNKLKRRETIMDPEEECKKEYNY